MSVINLHAKKTDLDFFHKNSEIKYDPSNKFYQVTFTYEFEKEAHDFIESFIGMVFSDEKFRDFGALPADSRMTDFYFSLLSEFQGLQWEKYNKWYFDKKAKIKNSIREIIENSMRQQKKLDIKDLEFFVWLSTETFIALMIEDYFTKHFDTVNIMKEALINHIGRAFEIIFLEIFENTAVNKLRAEKTGMDPFKLKPLLNRHAIAFNDAANYSNAEKYLLQKDSDIFIDRTIFNKLMSAFEAVVDKSKKFRKSDSMRNILSEPAVIKFIFSGKKERKNFAKIILKDKEFLERLVAKRERYKIEKKARAITVESGSSELLNFVRRGEIIEELFYEKKARKYIFKILKNIGSKKAEKLEKYINEAADRVKRSNGGFFDRLRPQESDKIMKETLENLSFYLSRIRDFYEVRKKYGKKSAYSDELAGIRILRQSIIRPVKIKEEGHERETLACVMIGDDRKTRIENLFEEANLFYIRREGHLYSGVEGGGGARGRKFFMFADLRNSTETTMKLTKDTAGFLTPYLSAVYKISKANRGNEIYFAGDGYAAHYNRVLDCIRTVYLIHREFADLRKEAEIKGRAKEKELLKNIIKMEILRTDGSLKKIKKIPESISEEMKEALKIIQKDAGVKIENVLKRVAAEYSMPGVEIGIGITEGELFVAVVGEENVRFNIVLSPSLTRAARLSGSSASVEEYVEKLYGVKKMPRKVYVKDRKLFNHGVVITSGVFNRLRKEVEVDIVEKEETGLSYDIYYYFDRGIDKYIYMAKLEQGVLLKGIESEVEIFEVFTPAASVNKYINNRMAKNGKNSRP